MFDGVFQLVHQRIVGEKHLKLVLGSSADSPQVLDAIAFNVDLERWPDEDVTRVRLAYRLDCNYYRGEERVQLMVEQIEAAD